MNDLNNSTPKKIGNFNIPKTVIECKVDTLAFLELLLRKKIATWDEIEEVRETVVLHMNVIYPELQLSYSSPAPLKDQAPLPNSEEAKKPLFYSAPPPEVANMNESINNDNSSSDLKPKMESKPASNAPLYASNMNQPKITNAIKPAPLDSSKPPMGNKPMNAPPRKKI